VEKPCDARVTFVFKRACNLMTADGHVIALVLPVVGDGPLNIVVDGSPGVFSVLEPGMSVWLDQGRPSSLSERCSLAPCGRLISGKIAQKQTKNGHEALCYRVLRVADLQIDLKKAVIWDARPNWKELRALQNKIKDRLLLLQSFALRTATEGSLLPLVSRRQGGDEPYLAGVKSLGSTSAIVFTAAREALGFLQTGWEQDESQLQTGAAQLAGLGGGLTPAGDDFLTGAMVWGWLAHPNPGFLGRLLFEAAAPRTTVLSAAILAAAARGECSAAWHALLASLSQGTNAEVDRAVRDVLSHGATSGADAMAGFLWAGLCCT